MEPAITLRTIEKDYPVATRADFSAIAAFWSQRLQRRRIWSLVEDVRKTLQQESLYHLRELLPEAKNDQTLEDLASAGLIEVCFAGGNTGFDIPWEFILSSATQDKRPHSRLLVHRHLVCRGDSRPPSWPKSLVVLLNNPGFLGSLYSNRSLNREHLNVRAHLGIKGLPPLHNEALSIVCKKLGTAHADVVHIAGVDGVQATQRNPGKMPPPGEETLIVAGETGGVHCATAAELGKAVCSGQSKPAFVGLNFVNSGSSIAPQMILNGAAAALGFLHDFDDILAETLFADFYLAWRLSNWNLLDAFRIAWSEIASPDPERMWGTAAVLWSRKSLIDPERRRRTPHHRSSPADPPDRLRRRFDSERDKPIPSALRSDVKVVAKPLAELNYSVLHNGHGPFEYIYVRKPQCVGAVKDLAVDVLLHTGEPAPYRATTDLNSSVWVLHDRVSVPLTSRLARSTREIVHTTLEVRVEWEGRALFGDTFRIRLLPIDQWQDDDTNRQWLPSFVLPRDPAVARIVEFAQPCLMALLDDAHAGFDGYDRKNPEAVDSQVRAVWWALLNNLPLGYISPPPVYTPGAQRLRSPSATLGGKRGTCIDLALLMSACLEYIGLYPLLFLTRGHAFAGYYRKQKAYENVGRWIAGNAKVGSDPWILGREFHPELLNLINAGDIVPIETTSLTRRGSFSASVDEAKTILQSADRFQWFFDVKIARGSRVTPLPLLEAE